MKTYRIVLNIMKNLNRNVRIILTEVTRIPRFTSQSQEEHSINSSTPQSACELEDIYTS